MKLGLAPAHFQVGTCLCLRVVSELAGHIGLLLHQVGEGQVEGFRMSWLEETSKCSLWEKRKQKSCSFQRVGLGAGPEHSVLLDDGWGSPEPA